VVQRDDDLVVELSVLDDRESARFFGVPLAKRGIQPVWLRITNTAAHTWRLRLASLDPSYYPPLEAAFINHHSIGKQLMGLGVLAWIWFPLLLLLPFRVLGAIFANRRMNAYFQEHGVGSGLIPAGHELAGFVFTTHDSGTKQVTLTLAGSAGAKTFAFSIPVAGLKLDHGGERFQELLNSTQAIECDEAELRRRLTTYPRSTTNLKGTVEGDPLNLVVIGDFDTILQGLGARWDETEIISAGTCWSMTKAFCLGREYRYAPVSSLYLQGRSQDFALQRARHTINQRLHLRLWMTPLRFQGKPVWIGQVSRDIGVRFTFKTWNLTTHAIDSNVDEARDYVLDDLMEAHRISHVAYVAGVQPCARTAPRHNLTGDPYFTDGLRAVAVFSETRTEPEFLEWD
jgi:hypothetical protein